MSDPPDQPRRRTLRHLTTSPASPPSPASGDRPSPGFASASVLVHDLLAGPVRPASVVATGSMATYLDVDGRIVPLVAAGGVRLPGAALLPPGLPPPPGDLAVGEGGIHQGGRVLVAVHRWFDPRVRLGAIDAVAVDRLATYLAGRPGGDPLLPADAPDLLASALADGVGSVESAVADLVGRGTGLTPAGDDLLAGTLAVLRARALPQADGLADAIRRHAPGRTTRLSASLLEAADQAAVIPQVEGVLRALATDPGRVPAAAEALLPVGHTSGWHLAAGLAVGASHALALAGEAPAGVEVAA